MPSEKMELLTVPEAAVRLGIGARTAWGLVARGELRSVKIASLRRVEAAEIERFISAQRGDGDGQ